MVEQDKVDLNASNAVLGASPRANFSISGCPLHIYKQFTVSAKELCADVYWVRLQMLLKAEEELETLKLALYKGAGDIEPSQPISVNTEVERSKPRYLGQKE